MNNTNVEIIVGVPSLNEEDSIGNVVTQVDKGLVEFFPDRRSLIVNVDSDSSDGTKDTFLSVPTQTPKEYVNAGRVGKGGNMFRLLEIANERKAGFICTVDSDLISIEPEWMLKLLNPIIENGFDYVVPVYKRNRYDGNITNHFCYPLLSAIYNVPIRQPIAGDFALKTELGRYILAQERITSAQHYGVDIFMTVSAITGEYKIKETYLGKKIHKQGFSHMIPITEQVSATLLFLTNKWLNSETSNRNLHFVPENKELRSGLDNEARKPNEAAVQQRKERALGLMQKAIEEGEMLTFENVRFLQDYSVNSFVTVERWAEYLTEVLKLAKDPKLNEQDFIKLGELLTPAFLLRVLSYFDEAEHMQVAEVETLINSQANLIRI